MPDYNKGDFTQQGIDGFVEGGLHLNEKRCLTARISTDEDSAGLDSVEINIHDHLNDLDYTITGENLVVGENTIGGGGGGGGMPFLTATIINNTNYGLSNVTTCAPKAEYGVDFNQIPVPATSTEIKEYLYEFMGNDSYIVRLYFEGVGVSQVTISYSNLVNCTFDENNGWLAITDPTENASATLTLTRES